MELGLKGKVVAVTGGSEGIGRATVQRFVAEGAKVAFCARRKDALDALASEMRTAGGDVMCMTGDASKAGEMEAFIEATVKHFGRIDVVVNNAGGSGQAAFASVLDEAWQNDINIKVFAQIRTARADQGFIEGSRRRQHIGERRGRRQNQIRRPGARRRTQ